MNSKPHLTEESIMTGVDSFAPTPRRILEATSPFFDEEEERAVSASLNARNKAADDAASNTSSASSDEEVFKAHKKAQGAAATPSAIKPKTPTKKILSLKELTEVDLSGADPAPSLFSPANGQRVPLSPFEEALESKSSLSPLKAQVAAANIRNSNPLKQVPNAQKQSPSSRPPAVQQPLSGTRTSGQVTVLPATTSASRTTKTPVLSTAGANVKRPWSSSLRDDSKGQKSPYASPKPASPAPKNRTSAIKIDLTNPEASSPARGATRQLLSSSVLTQAGTTTRASSTRPVAPTLASNEPIKEDDWAVERRELLNRARKAEKRLALLLIESATRRRKDKMIKYHFSKWRATARPSYKSPETNDAELLALELLERLRNLRA